MDIKENESRQPNPKTPRGWKKKQGRYVKTRQKTEEGVWSGRCDPGLFNVEYVYESPSEDEPYYSQGTVK